MFSISWTHLTWKVMTTLHVLYTDTLHYVFMRYSWWILDFHTLFMKSQKSCLITGKNKMKQRMQIRKAKWHFRQFSVNFKLTFFPLPLWIDFQGQLQRRERFVFDSSSKGIFSVQSLSAASRSHLTRNTVPIKIEFSLLCCNECVTDLFAQDFKGLLFTSIVWGWHMSQACQGASRHRPMHQDDL